MEEDRLLDASRKALSFLFIVFLLSSCRLPRIAVLHDPLTPEEHVNLGVSYEKKGELDAALAQYEAASKELPAAYLYMGNVYFQKNDSLNAERFYRKAIEKTGDARARNNLAWLYYTRGERLDEAENLARMALAMSPESSDFKDTLDKIVEKRAALREGR
jgi:tetratricopeptide (TPR) repeat protein